MAMPALNIDDIRVTDERVTPARIPLDLDVLNVLRQTRQTMIKEDTEALAISILQRGQVMPGRVAVFTRREAEKYLEEINALFGTGYNVSELKSLRMDGKVRYLIVVFGHRRLQACKLAAARLKAGETSREFDGSYKCDLHRGLSFDDAITAQLTENHYVPVPLHEEIEASWLYWRFLSRREKIDAATFAKRIGRNPEWVRDMLRFTTLPESIQARIKPGEDGRKVPYGILLQLVRKRNAYVQFNKIITDDELETELDMVIVRDVKVADYTKQVSREIESLSDGQESLFAAGELMLSREMVRKTVRRELVPKLTAIASYFADIHAMASLGRFGQVDLFAEDKAGEYSPQSPAAMMSRVFKWVIADVPDLTTLLRRDKRSTVQLERAMSAAGLELSEIITMAESSNYEASSVAAE